MFSPIFYLMAQRKPRFRLSVLPKPGSQDFLLAQEKTVVPQSPLVRKKLTWH
jgi:hypothetical protein